MKALFIWKDGSRDMVEIDPAVGPTPIYELLKFREPPLGIEDDKPDEPVATRHTFRRVNWNDGSFHYEEGLK